MNTIQLKQWLIRNGFASQSVDSDRYWGKPIGNGWYINVEWQGDSKYPIVQATHNSQFKPTLKMPWYVPYDSDHTNLIKSYGITVNKRYVRNKESRTFANMLVPMAVECLVNRLSK